MIATIITTIIKKIKRACPFELEFDVSTKAFCVSATFSDTVSTLTPVSLASCSIASAVGIAPGPLRTLPE